MSRVWRPYCKYVNSPKYAPSVYQPSKITVIQKGTRKTQGQIPSLTAWLDIRYGMSYKAYRGKSRKRREELREEYEEEVTAPMPEGESREVSLKIAP